MIEFHIAAEFDEKRPLKLRKRTVKMLCRRKMEFLSIPVDIRRTIVFDFRLFWR